MDEAVTVSSPDELIAVVPHVLGFRPRESMVCVPFGDGPVARVDLPATESEVSVFVSSLADVYGPLGGGPMALVAFSDDARRALQAMGPLIDAVGQGKQLGPVLWVRGDEWTELTTVTRGRVSASAVSLMDAEFVVRGSVMPRASREDLVDELSGDVAPIQALLPQATRRFESLTAAGRARDCVWVEDRVRTFLADRSYLDDGDAARLLVAFREGPTYGVVVMGIRRQYAALHRELWLDLTRRAPEPVRDRPASVLALASWLDGKGAHAWLALDVVRHPEDVPLARMRPRVLEDAMDPAIWDRVNERRPENRQHGSMSNDRTKLGRSQHGPRRRHR